MFVTLSRFSRRDLFLILTLLVFVLTSLVFTFLLLPKIKSYIAVTKIESILRMVVDNGDLLDNQIAALSSDIDSLQRRLHGDMASLPVKEIEAHVVGKLQQSDKLAPNFSQHTHAESGTWKRMAVDHLARQSEFHADLTNLIFEQFAQRFHQLHAHVFRQAAYVVV